jgi:uncharacterized protein YdhG (YjbR/CyaY superfamily)
MARQDIDQYLEALEEPKRTTLEALRTAILESVLETLADDVARYETSKGSLRFAIGKPLPKRLVKKLVVTRRRELGLA